MQNFRVKAMQSDLPDYGKLQIHITSARGAQPIPGAKVAISYTGEPDQTMEELTTNSSGQTDEVELAAPPLEYSVEPSEPQPYSEYTLSVTAPGYEPVEIAGTEILPEVTAIQEIRMQPGREKSMSAMSSELILCSGIIRRRLLKRRLSRWARAGRSS